MEGSARRRLSRLISVYSRPSLPTTVAQPGICVTVASFFLFLFLFLLALPAFAQTDEVRFGAGGSLVGTIPVTEGDDINPSWGVRAFVRYRLLEHVSLEGGGGYFTYVDRQRDYDQLDVEGSAIPVDLRALYAPWPDAPFSPFLFAGIGLTFFDADNPGTHLSPLLEHGELSANYVHIPVGIGASLALSRNVRVEFQAGNNLGLSDGLNPNLDGTNDHMWVGTAGFFYRFGSAPEVSGDEEEFPFELFEEAAASDASASKENADMPKPDGPDADGDGLSDREENERYRTDPLKKDSDGDGLTDGEEAIRYKTDPRRKDTDGDGLGDREEILTYRTNPLNVDSDGDGLTDGAEVQTLKTDPNNPDTDGDGLTDGEEVKKYRTDPLKKEL